MRKLGFKEKDVMLKPVSRRSWNEDDESIIGIDIIVKVVQMDSYCFNEGDWRELE